MSDDNSVWERTICTTVCSAGIFMCIAFMLWEWMPSALLDEQGPDCYLCEHFGVSSASHCCKNSVLGAPVMMQTMWLLR